MPLICVSASAESYSRIGTHFASRSTFAGGVQDITEPNLREWLKDPDNVKPGNHMAELAGAYIDPNLALKDEDIDTLVAYLQSLE